MYTQSAPQAGAASQKLMLKRLFTSNTRIKLLTLFLLNPDEEYFIRELTRRLDEQINSVRRELDNLKKMGLLKSKEKNRKKYYVVNKNFVIFHELKGIILKAMGDKDALIKKIAQMGNIDVMVLSGLFVEKESPLDLLLVGNVDRQHLEDYLNNQLETERPVRYSVLTRDDYLYRRQCKDKFLHDLVDDPENIAAINRLEKTFSV
jgi:DNA-binding transcriptional ArsR family regulator